MAKTLSAFPQEAEIARGGRYPWGKWLDGQVWHLERGTEEEVGQQKKDYYVSTKSFRSAITQAVKAVNKTGRKGKVRTAVVEEDGAEGIIVQFLPEPAKTDSE